MFHAGEYGQTVARTGAALRRACSGSQWRQAAWGDVLGSNDDTPGEAAVKRPAAKQEPKKPDRDRDMGDALRSVYDRTVQESVPDEMLDLLSKLD